MAPSKLGLTFSGGPDRDNSVGSWNPAWGPRPEPKRSRTPSKPKPKSCLYQISCPQGCTDDVLVWGPVDTYICTHCGDQMTLTRIVKQRRPPDVSVHPGERYGRLVVQSLERIPGKNLSAVCLCDCGVVKSVGARHLRSGRTRSCGCLFQERKAEHPWTQSYKDMPDRRRRRYS